MWNGELIGAEIQTAWSQCLALCLLALQSCTHYLITLSFHFPFVELAIEPAVSNVMKIKGNNRYNPLSAVRLVVNVQ